MRLCCTMPAARRQSVARLFWFMLPLLLHACAGDEPVPAEATCPNLLVVQEASRFVLHGEPDDPVGLVATLSGLRWSCTFLPESHLARVTAQIDVLVEMTRRDELLDVSFPLFVALEDRDGRIVSKRVFDSPVRILPGPTQIFYSQAIDQEFGYARMADVAGHTIYVGFQIGPEDLLRLRTGS